MSDSVKKIHKENRKNCMKKTFKIASLVHLILWIGFLILSIVGRVTFKAPDAEPLDYTLSIGMYNFFTVAAIAGILTALSPYMSVSHMCNPLVFTNSIFHKLALLFSVLTIITFYLFLIMLPLNININEIIVLLVLPAIWISFLVISYVMFILSKRKQCKRA